MDHSSLVSLDRLSWNSPRRLRRTDARLHAEVQNLVGAAAVRATAEHLCGGSEPLREVVDGVDLPPAKNAEALRRDALRAIEDAGADDEVVAEARSRLDQLDLEPLFDRDRPLASNPALSEELRQGRLHRLGESAGLREEAVTGLIDAAVAPAAITTELLAARVAADEMTAGEAARLGLVMTVASLCDDDLDLVTSVLGSDSPPAPLVGPVDLVTLTADHWEALLRDGGATRAPGGPVRVRAERVRRTVTAMFPNQALGARLSEVSDPIVEDLTTTAPLLGIRNDSVASASFGDLDVERLKAATVRRMEGPQARLRALASRYPGLGLAEILDDKSQAVDDRARAVNERVEAFRSFWTANDHLDLLSLDYGPGSTHLDELHFGGLRGRDRERVLTTVKAYARVYNVADDVDDAVALVESGLHSALDVSAAGVEAVTDAGLDRQAAERVVGRADVVANRTLLAAANAMLLTERVPDVRLDRDGGEAIDTDHGIYFNEDLVHPDGAARFFREVEGYDALFGRQDYCQCDECGSIISPAAYLVDLLRFVETNVLRPAFGNTVRLPSDLRDRRPDLWTLELSCDNTNKQIPILQIVAEVVERYIAKQIEGGVDVADPAKRARLVHQALASFARSSRLPYSHALARIDTYLHHFDHTRAEIAVAARRTPDLHAAAALSMSWPEHQLIVTARAQLANLNGIHFTFAGAGVAPFEADDLMTALAVDRSQLSDLLASSFVTDRGQVRLKIEAPKRSDQSVQPDYEVVTGLTAEALDRLDRLVRLSRRIPAWTIRELDLVLHHLQMAGVSTGLDAAALVAIARLLEVQKRLAVNVEELVALFHAVPTVSVSDDAPSLFDRCFNQPTFTAIDGSYPATGSAPTNAELTLLRLQAGCSVSAGHLRATLHHLQAVTEVNIEVDQPVVGRLRTSGHLSTIWRHARLAMLIGRSADELFQMVQVARLPGDVIDSLDSLAALLDFDEWLRASDADLDEVAWLTGAQTVGHFVPPDPALLAGQVAARASVDSPFAIGADLFVGVDPVIDRHWSSEIFSHNPGAFVAVGKTGTYRVTGDDLQIEAFKLPAGLVKHLNELVASTSEATARHTHIEWLCKQQLFSKSPSSLVPPFLAQAIGVEQDAIDPILAITEITAGDLEGLAAELVASETLGVTRLKKVIGQMLPASHLLVRAKISSRLLGLVKSQFLAKTAAGPSTGTAAQPIDEDADALGVVRYAALALADVQAVLELEPCTGGDDERADSLRAALDVVLKAHSWENGFPGAKNVKAALARVLGVQPALMASLVNTLSTSHQRSVTALVALGRAARLCEALGIGPEGLLDISAPDEAALSRGADALYAAIRASYPSEEKWTELSVGFDGVILTRQRDALVAYLLATGRPRFTSIDDIYDYFLLDPEFDGCFERSRIVAAIASVQLYVRRILLRKEEYVLDWTMLDRLLSSSPTNHQTLVAEWPHRQHFRYWQANRETFLRPEELVKPTNRHDKTPLFKAFEDQLLQNDITPQSILDAYATYLEGFDTVASLPITGAFHDVGPAGQSDVLHLFGSTSADPPVHYRRSVKDIRTSTVDGAAWGSWQELNLKIPVRPVAPVVLDSRMHLFWSEITTSPQNEVLDGQSIFVGYKHAVTVKAASLRIDGSWTSPQAISARNLAAFEGGECRILDPLAGAANLTGLARIEKKNLGELAVDEFDDITPRYDYRTHLKPRDGYSLQGDEWARVFPTLVADVGAGRVAGAAAGAPASVAGAWGVVLGILGGISSARPATAPVGALVRGPGLVLTGAGFQLRGEPDLFERTLRDVASMPGFGAGLVVGASEPEIPRPLVRRLDGYVYDRGAISGLFDALPLAWLVADPEMRVRVFGWSHGLPDPTAALFSSPLVGASFYLGSPFESLPPAVPLMQVRPPASLVPVNRSPGGAVDEYLALAGADAMLAQRDALKWRLRRLSTSLARPIARRLFERGVDGLLNTRFQASLTDCAARTRPSSLPPGVSDWVLAGYRHDAQGLPIDQAQDESTVGFDPSQVILQESVATLDFRGPYGVYLREIFFYIPWLIADQLNQQGRYEEAQKWYRHLFDPTANQEALAGDVPNVRPWRYVEWRRESMQGMRSALSNARALRASHEETFSPHAIAELRPGTYQRAIVLAYVDNLLDWADSKFAEFQDEPVNEAIMLYAEARRILGLRPKVLGACSDGVEITMADFRPVSPGDEAALEYLREIEHWVTPADEVPEVAPVLSEPPLVAGVVGDAAGPDPADPGGNLVGDLVAVPIELDVTERRDGVIGNTRIHELVWQSRLGFCIPPDADLIRRWDRLEGHLRLLHTCCDITGAKRELALFAPKIDPARLADLRAMGLPIEDFVDQSSMVAPPFRFAFLIEKAKGLAATADGFSTQVLAAMERQDGEALTKLQLTQQREIEGLTSAVREMETAVAESGLEVLRRRKASLEQRRAYYTQLLAAGLNVEEFVQRAAAAKLFEIRTIEATLGFLAGAVHLIPELGSPFALKFGGKQTGDAARSISVGMSAVASQLEAVSSFAGLEAGFSRRAEGWRQELTVTNGELAQVQEDIRGAGKRLELATRMQSIHERSIQHTDSLMRFHAEKATGAALYATCVKDLLAQSRAAFTAALSLARMAEAAYRFERDDTVPPFVTGGYWKSENRGLHAGNALLSDLIRMENRFLEQTAPLLHVNQPFSLAQIAPEALVKLQKDGWCRFTVPELWFDLFYPGHYNRKIRMVKLSIPCVTGPFVSVGATLTLLGGKIRRQVNDADRLPEPRNLPNRRSIATSTAQADSGVFEFSFRDEEYLPFEGAGAVDSEWELRLPTKFPQFDYQTIADVIVHASYTALADSEWREKVESGKAGKKAEIATKLATDGIERVLSLRFDFPDAFRQLLSSPEKTVVTFKITQEMFPYFLRDRKLGVKKARLAVRSSAGDVTGLKLKVGTSEVQPSGVGSPEVDVTTRFPAGPVRDLEISVIDPDSLKPPAGRSGGAIDPGKLLDLYLVFTITG